MRRILAILAAAALIQASTGCRHTAGGCDCEHAGQGGVAGKAAPAGPVVASPSNQPANPAGTTSRVKLPNNAFNPAPR